MPEGIPILLSLKKSLVAGLVDSTYVIYNKSTPSEFVIMSPSNCEFPLVSRLSRKMSIVQ